MKDTYDIFNETVEAKNARLAKQREYSRNKRNSVIEAQGKLSFDDIVVNLPTTSLDGETIREGERNPPVKKRVSILDFVLSDIGNTMSTVGFMSDIKTDDRHAVITITDENERHTFNLYMEEAFYINSKLNINSMFEALKQLYLAGEDIIVICVGEVVLREAQFGMLIMDESKLNFNRGPLSTLLINANKLF